MKQKALLVVKSLMDLRPGERLMALLMFLYLLLVIGAFSVVKPVRSSLFLQQFGARNLPYIYLATALLAGGTAWIHSRLLDRFSIISVLAMTQAFFIANLVFFWFALRSDAAWLSAAFFLWVNIFTVTVNTLFWMFANHYYTSREAKRLYGFINAGGTVGGIAGGFAVASVVRSIGTENMLLVCAAVLGVCIALTYVIQRVGVDRFGTPTAAAEEISARSEPITSVFETAYPKYIAMALGLSLVISTLIDYQFNVGVERTYLDKEAKTAFFSSFTAAVNALSLVLQLFLTGQLLRRLGIGWALLVLPATLLGGSAWMVAGAGLAPAIFLKVADGSIRYSLEQSTRDLLYLPIAARLMRRLKTFVDVFVQRLAKGVGAFLILALTVWWALSAQSLSYLAIALGLLWLMVAVLLRREYREQLKGFLFRAHGDEAPKLVRVLDETAIVELLKAVESGDDETVLYSLALLEGSRDERLVTLLRAIVRRRDGSSAVKGRALHVLAELGDSAVVAEAEALLAQDAFEPQDEVIHYLCVSSPEGATRRLQAFLAADDPRRAAAAMACLVNCGGADGARRARPMLEMMLADTGPQRVAKRAVLANTLGHIRPPSSFHQLLNPLLEDPSPDVARAALAAAGLIRRRDFVPLVIMRLAEPPIAAAALDTLRVYGHTVLGTLRDHIGDEAVPIEIRRQLTSVFASVGTNEAARDLVRCLHQRELSLRHAVIKALNKIRDREPAFDIDRSHVDAALAREIEDAYRRLGALSLLTPVGATDAGADAIVDVDRLTDEYRASVERIFRLLGLVFPPRDIYAAYRGVHSPRRELRANAIELLDTTLSSPLRLAVIPLVDDELPIEEKLRIGKSLAVASPEPARIA